MRIIKPGRVAPVVPSGKPVAQRIETQPAKPAREVWDDFGGGKKTRKKREYERGDGNRMVAKPTSRSHDTLGLREGEAPVDQGFEAPKYREDLGTLEEKLGYTFQDRTHLLRALTHRSALAPKERSDYERLEFLGDAVLDLSIAHLLSDRYPDAKEGELSKMRAALVNTQALAGVAKVLDLGPFIRLGRGEVSSGGQERPSILADVTEAVMGAIYRDSGYQVAFDIIHRVFGESLDQVQPSDPKTELQEALHAAGSEPPQYLLELVEGPEHAPTFVTVVIVDGEIAGRGRGPTKKAAQQAAAAEALGKMTPSGPMLELTEKQNALIPELLLMPKPAAPGGGAPEEGSPAEAGEPQA